MHRVYTRSSYCRLNDDRYIINQTTSGLHFPKFLFLFTKTSSSMFKTIFRISNNFFLRRQTNVLTAASVIMATVLLSRILGLLRDRMLASYFPKEELGVYLAAFRLPNLLFELLIMGVLSTAFIPVFTHYLTEKKEEEGFEMAHILITLSTGIIFVLCVFSVIFARYVSRFMAPGFSEAEITQMVLYTRIILIGQVVPLVVGNFLTGILQSYQRFIIPAFAPVVYNVGIIIGIVLLSPSFGLFGASFGVVLGGVLFLLIHVPFMGSVGYHYTPHFSLTHTGVRRVFRLIGPRTIGLAVSQIDTTVDLILASYLGAGSVTIFYFAQHLQQLPIGLFGATIAQAALPAMSASFSQKNKKQFEELFLASYHQILFLVFPVSMILFVLRIPMVRLVFGASEFDWPGTVLTGATLAFFSISLFAQSLVHLFVRAFYAVQDTKTPVAIGMVAVAINTVLSVICVSVLRLPVWSLALSASLASIVNFVALLVLFDIKIQRLSRHGLIIPPFKMLVATAISGIFLYVPMKLFDQLIFDTTRVFDLLLLTGLATTLGICVYLFFAWFLAIEEVTTFINLLKKIKKVPQIIFSRSEELVNESQNPAV